MLPFLTSEMLDSDYFALARRQALLRMPLWHLICFTVDLHSLQLKSFKEIFRVAHAKIKAFKKLKFLTPFPNVLSFALNPFPLAAQQEVKND